jgi:hypothetical protein
LFNAARRLRACNAVVIDLFHYRISGLGDEADKGRSISVIGDEDEMVLRVIGNLIRAGGSTSGDNMRNRVCVGVDDGDRTIVEPNPKLVGSGYGENSILPDWPVEWK